MRLEIRNSFGKVAKNVNYCEQVMPLKMICVKISYCCNIAVIVSLIMFTGPQVDRSFKRLRGKQPAPPSRHEVFSYAAAWRHYIRGNVVSQHACRHSEAFPKSVFQLCQQDMKVSLALQLEVTTVAATGTNYTIFCRHSEEI